MNAGDVQQFLAQANPLDVPCQECRVGPDEGCVTTAPRRAVRSRPPHPVRKRRVVGERVRWLTTGCPEHPRLALVQVQQLWAARYNTRSTT